MDWDVEAVMAARVLIATVLGGFVGLEREWHARDAGIRTYGAVSLGACVFALLSTHITGGDNPHVISAGVVSGIGFLGAGVIMREKGSVVGLTTAATLWSSASVGMAVGYGMYVLAVLVAILVFVLLGAHHVPFWPNFKKVTSSKQGSSKEVKGTERSPRQVER